MSKNSLYQDEIATARNFVIDRNYDSNLLRFLENMKDESFMHSDRWSMIYDFMKEYYPGQPSPIITGLSYWVES